MPRMGHPQDDSASAPSYAKALIIGDGKCGKTDWACRAAKAGFNLLYIDGDVGRQTIKAMLKPDDKGNPPRLTQAEADRIFLIDATDTMGGGKRDSKFIDTFEEFASTTLFRWNDSKGRIATKTDVGDTIWEIKPSKLDQNTVLVIDSWTGLCESIMLRCAIANGVDISNADTKEMRPVYQGGGLKATQVLQVIRSMKCHVIVIAHPDEYNHLVKPTGQKVGAISEKDMVIDWVKLIPKSTSKPHSMQMAKYFTDILWIETNATGSERLVNAKLSDSKMSGGHWNDRKNTDDYSFAKLVQQVGGVVPTEPQPIDAWFREMIQEEVVASPLLGAKPTTSTAATPTEPAKVLDGTISTQVKSPGMAAFMKKAAG